MDRIENLTESAIRRFDVVVEGEFYKEGSSHPWGGGTHIAVVAAESAAEAIIEVLEGLGNHGRIESESGDTDWTCFDDEREFVFRVTPHDEEGL